MTNINIIGGGLAGVECANMLTKHGFKVTLYEMKPKKFSPAHKAATLGEIVCSNSLKNTDPLTSSGLLKAEMERIGSLVLEVAKQTSVPAGGALAVDRDKFSKLIDTTIKSNKNITVCEQEITSLPINSNEIWVVATGPLTSDALYNDIKEKLGNDGLHFFDASAPIVLGESVDKQTAFKQDRYKDLGSGDYLNCPMTKEEYLKFYNELINAERATLHEFEKKEIFEGCMPIEIMASRGEDALRYGPLKPVGLGRHLPNKPYAIVQLRKENVEEECFNLVGFQTNLKYSEQKRVFSLIPALKNAEFIKYGVMHRNSYINSPLVLNKNLSLKKYPHIYIAGQLSGVEGYVESSASGMLVALSIILSSKNKSLSISSNTMLGALVNYITNKDNANNFQPMNSNYGIIAELEDKSRDKKENRAKVLHRSLAEIDKLIKENNLCK